MPMLPEEDGIPDHRPLLEPQRDPVFAEEAALTASPNPAAAGRHPPDPTRHAAAMVRTAKALLAISADHALLGFAGTFCLPSAGHPMENISCFIDSVNSAYRKYVERRRDKTHPMLTGGGSGGSLSIADYESPAQKENPATATNCPGLRPKERSSEQRSIGPLSIRPSRFGQLLPSSFRSAEYPAVGEETYWPPGNRSAPGVGE